VKEVLLGLLLWISQNTGMVYDGEGGLPEVKRVDSRQLATLFFKGQVPAYLSPIEVQRMTEHIEALYHPDTKIIYVRKSVDLTSTYGKSALVHELVHFLQYQRGIERKVSCVNALEKDAYRVQAAYLRQKGEEPTVDGFTIVARSMC
jgi:hypothetical protein